MGKLKCTPGPVTINKNGHMSAPGSLWIPMRSVSLTSGETAEANDALLMDALNVYHETGMTPRELVRMIGCLERAMRHCLLRH